MSLLQRLTRNRELLGISDANSRQQGKDVQALDLSTKGEAHEGTSYDSTYDRSVSADRLL